MDSRAYRFIYQLRNNDDIPADFPREIRNCDFESGVFVPQGDSNCVREAPPSPACLLLLKRRSLQIVFHPAAQQQSPEIDLSDLLQLETATVLLLGWLKWTTPGGIQELRYNTRASYAMNHFLRKLRRRWLAGEPKLTPRAFPMRYGDELDIKFKNLFQQEIDPGEAPILMYFQPPVKLQRAIVFRRRVEWKPGHLISLTTHRLLWITDQYKRYRDPYLSVNCSAPTTLVHSCECIRVNGECFLSLYFDSGVRWSIPLDATTTDLDLFIDSFRETACAKSLAGENQ